MKKCDYAHQERYRRVTKAELTCSVCGKRYETLGDYGDDVDCQMICFRCFEQADAISAQQNRWPDGRDFRYLRDMKKHHQK